MSQVKSINKHNKTKYLKKNCIKILSPVTNTIVLLFCSNTCNLDLLNNHQCHTKAFIKRKQNKNKPNHNMRNAWIKIE